MIPYFVAGYPSFRQLREHLWEAREAGVTAVELGIPFSDPVADGPTIQAALQRALERGVTVRKALDLVSGLRREGYELPILGMTYANVLYTTGYDAAASAWARAGLDGAIIPDVPLEESGPLRAALRRKGLATVSFASPATSNERLRSVLRARDGFVYLVAVYGTTGSRKDIAPETRELLARARRLRPRGGPPLCVGFGVSNPRHVATLASLGADGVVVGSALVNRLGRHASVRSFLAGLVAADARTPPREPPRSRVAPKML